MPRKPMLASGLAFLALSGCALLGPQLLGILRSGTLEYRVHGTVQLEGALAITLPFSRSGRLDPLTAGSLLLADAGAPAGTRCGRAP